MSNYPKLDDDEKKYRSEHFQTENLDNSSNVSGNFQIRIDVPNNIENQDEDSIQENNKKNNRINNPINNYKYPAFENLDYDQKLDWNNNPPIDQRGNSLNTTNPYKNKNNASIINPNTNYIHPEEIQNKINNPNIPNERSGDITSSPEQVNNIEMDTLDEKVTDTLKRELKRICYKLECVLLPRFSANKGKEIHNWDLWGPLLFILILSATISFSTDSSASNTNTTIIGDTSEKKGNGRIFVILFFLFWVGGFIITMNSRFLGCNLNIFQSLCLLGYCIFPINLSAAIIRLIISESFVKVIIVGVSFIWCCISSIGFISGFVQQEKKMVCVYPIFLFYLVISWFVLTM